MKSVAVEHGLEPVEQYLQTQGCNTIHLDNAEASARGAAVMVITGGDKNIMGMQSVVQNIPIISAAGLTPEDVYDRVRNYIQ